MDKMRFAGVVLGVTLLVGCGEAKPKVVSLRAGATEVLVGAKATPSTRFAAQELTNFLSRVFAVDVPVVTAPTPGRLQIVVGDNEWSRAEGLAPEKLEKDDAFIIRATTNRVYLCGVDGDCRWYADVINAGRGGPGMMQGRRSSSFAVYEFLERYAGCRFYWPGELGEIVPRAASVSVPLGERIHAPDFIIRKYYHPSPVGALADTDGKKGWIDGNEYTFAKGTMLNWSRLRMGSFDIPCCHGVNRFYMLDRFGKTHPEYFALKKDGKRFTTYEGYESSTWGMLCFSSAVTNEIYLDAKSYLLGEDPSVRKVRCDKKGTWYWPTCFRQGKYVDIMPNDSQYACQCEKCLAKYTPKDKDPTGNFMTELIWGYTADVARRLISDGVPGYVTQMAYAQYSRPPAFDLPTNIMVMVAKTGPFSMRKPEQLAKDNAAIRAWKAKTGRVWIWTYPNKYGNLNVAGVPTMTPHAWGDYYRQIAPDVFGAFAESECDRFFFNHLNYYVFSKVCWDNSTDVNAVLDEYFRLMYGAAAPEAKAFCEALENRFLDRMVGQVENTPAGPMAKAPSVHEVWTDVYGPKILGEWEALLDRGAAKLAAGSIEAKRFKVFRDELFGVMRRTGEAYLDATDSTRNAARYKASPPKRNLIDMDATWHAFTRDAEEKIVTDRSFKVVSTNGNASTLYYLDGRCAETLKPNTRYRLSFFIKGKDITPTRKGGGAGITLCDAYNHSFPRTAGLTGTFDWTYQTFEFKSDPESNNRCKSYLYLRIGGANGTAWFDGLSLVEIPEQVVKPGACAVVLAPDASPVTRFAADELARFLTKRFSGKTVPVKTAITEGEFAFVVGDNAWSRAAGLAPEKLPRDGFAIRTAPGRVYICGRDDPKADLAKRLEAGQDTRFEMASVFGVYDFLERFADCRFFFPGELGECVRRGDDLPLQTIDCTSAPDYTARRIYDGRKSVYFDGDGTRGKALNQVRTRMETENIPCCHGLRTLDYINRFGKTHPEYFALQQGRRNTDPNYRFPHQFCFTSGIREEIYRDAVKRFKAGARYFDAMPQDEMVACECAACRKAYSEGPADQPATELVWGNVADWGKRLIKEGISGQLTLLAYSPYKAVPRVDLPTNVQVMVAVGGPFMLNDPARLAKEDALVKRWKEKVGHRVWLWTYPDKYGNLDIPGVPCFAAQAWGRFYGERKEDIFGAFAESESDRWFYQHLNYYVYGKVSWNTGVNVDILMSDYLNRMFGPSVVQWYMGSIIRSLEEKWTKDIAGRTVDTTMGPMTSPPSDEDIWTKIFSPKVIAGYDSQLTAAFKAAEKLPDPLIAKRVQLYRREIYEPMKAASDAYFARRKAVAGQKTLKAGETIPFVPFYNNAARVFSKTQKKDLPGRDLPGTAKIWKENGSLRATFDLVEPNMDDVLAAKRKRDDRLIWMDNSVELYICPSGDRNVRYQVLVNSLGCHAEVRHVRVGQSSTSDWDWNPDLKVKVGRTKKGWRCDLSIPLSALGEMSNRVPVEFCRTRKLKSGGQYQQLFHTSPLVDRFGCAADFAEVAF